MQGDSLRVVGFLKDKVLIGPERLAIRVTNRCNYACFYCGNHSKLIDRKQNLAKSDIDFSLFKNLIDDAQSLKVDQIVLLGSGEPFLHEHIYDMIDYVKQKGLRLSILSNGTFNKKKMRVVCKADHFSINLNSFDEDMFRKTQNGTSEDHQSVLENLKILSDLKRVQGFPHIRLVFLLHKLNIEEIDTAVNWAKRHSIDSLEFKLPVVRSEMKDYVLDIKGVEKMHLIFKGLIDRGEPFLANTNIKFLYEKFSGKEIEYQKGAGDDIVYYKQSFEDGFQCPAGWYYATVDVNGNVYPCCHYREDFNGGNVYETSFKEIWEGRAFSDARKKMKYSIDMGNPFWQRCNNCSLMQDLNQINQKVRKFRK